MQQGLIVCDVSGLTLTEDDKKRISHPLVGAVILFTRNYKDRDQLKALCDAIHSVKEGLLICVDHEGGRVQRFLEGFTKIPAMRCYGELYRKDPEKGLAAARAAGYVLASELRALGVDFTFAPVLDLEWGHSAIIGERSFGAGSELVSTVARAVIAGLREAGMTNCGKHFPGHGWAEADSHLALPEDERSLEVLRAADAKPYETLAGELDSVMTAHVLYRAIDSVPASFSRRIVTGLLRETLRFDGLIFSDDLTMKGAVAAGSILVRAKKALDAGCDALIVCNAPDTVDELLENLDWQPTEKFKERIARLQPRGIALTWDELIRSERYRDAKNSMMAIKG